MKFETVVQVFGRDPALVEMLEKSCGAHDDFIVREGRNRFPTTTEVNRGFHRGHGITQLCVEGRLDDLARMLEVAAKSAGDDSLDPKYRQKALLIHVTFLDVLAHLEEKAQKLYPGKPVPARAPLEVLWTANVAFHSSIAQGVVQMFPGYTEKRGQKHKIANQQAMDKCAAWDSAQFELYYRNLATQQAVRSAQVDAFTRKWHQ